jgi:hypothetical protein
VSQEEHQLAAQERHLAELGETARRAQSIVTEQVNTIVETVAHRAQDITRSAERDADIARRDADMARREAHESARRVLERIGALERPLGELVMTLRHEMNRLAGQLEGRGPDVTSYAVEAPSRGDRAIPASQPEAPAEEEPRKQEPPAKAEEPAPAADSAASATEEPAPAAEPEATEPAEAETTRREPAFAEPAHPEEEPPPLAASVADEEPTQEAAERKRRRVRGAFGRLRGKGSRDLFITTPGNCAVCQRSFAAGSPEELETSGWLVSGDVGLCPECQSEGWQLPEGARLPFRRGSG